VFGRRCGIGLGFGRGVRAGFDFGVQQEVDGSCVWTRTWRPVCQKHDVDLIAWTKVEV
jgi:hypothetical protein